MIFLKLFLTFFEIGAVSFGGGYGMISLIRETVISNGWLTEGEFMNFIAVSESTPGPIAVNIATFVGTSKGGFFGGMCATLGVVLPSFIIILIISSIMKNLLKYRGVVAFLSGVRPCVVALILSTACTMGLKTIFNFSSVSDKFSPDIKGLIIFVICFATAFLWKKFKGKKPSPIILILISGVLGMLLYSDLIF